MPFRSVPGSILRIQTKELQPTNHLDVYMGRSPDASAVLVRVGAGTILGALLFFLLAALLLPEIGALLVIGAGLGAYALEQLRSHTPGLSAGLVAAAILPILDRQLDPLGATLVRSTAATVVIGVGLIVGALVVDRYGERIFGSGPEP